MTPSRTPRERPRSYLKSGVYTLKKAVQTLGSRALPPKSTALGRALHEWREALLADLGGVEAVSTQRLALVDLAVRTRLLVDSVDAFVLAMPSPVNRQRRCLHPVVRERQALVGQLQSILRDLGLERKAKKVDLAAMLAALHRQPAPAGDASVSAGGEGGMSIPSKSSATLQPSPKAPVSVEVSAAEAATPPLQPSATGQPPAPPLCDKQDSP